MILYPIKKATRKDDLISQPYGANADFYKKYFPGLSSHDGVDIVSQHGDELLACEDFTPFMVFNLETRPLDVGLKRGWGFHALSDPDENGVCREWVYWHMMSNVQIKFVERVVQGSVVGYEGNSGPVYVNGIAVDDSMKGVAPYPGTHVHWGYREVMLVNSGDHCITDIDGAPYRNPITGQYYEVIDFNNGNEGFKDPMLLPIEFYDEYIVQTATGITEQIETVKPSLSTDQQDKVTDAELGFWKSLFAWLKGRGW